MTNEWKAKQLKLDDAIQKIPMGSHIYAGNMAASPQLLMDSLVLPQYGMVDTEIIQFFPGSLHPSYMAEETSKRFRANTFYVTRPLSNSIREGWSDYTPLSISDIPRLIRNGQIKVDVVLLKVAPPDESGMCNLGIGLDITPEVIAKASLVIAEVNEHMPRTCGQSAIPSAIIHYWVENNAPLMNMEQLFVPVPLSQEEQDVYDEIGRHIAGAIEDGSTLHVGLGKAPNYVLKHLHSHQHLGIHTELLTDGLMRLIQSGAVDNSNKTFMPGKTVISHCFGSQELYDYIHNNQDLEFTPLSRINHVETIGSNPKMVAIDEGFEVDLTGQVCSESRGYEFLGGFGGKSDFTRGAMASEGGKAFVVMPSTHDKGRAPSIVTAFRKGTGVVLTRAEVQHVCTEYGIAYLYGKTIRERSLSLIEISHPKFRDNLLKFAKQHNYVSQTQPGHSFKGSYPSEWESVYIARNGNRVLIRPIKAVDEGHVKDFFHKLSDRSIYMRYFKHIRSLPQLVLQKFTDIDYSRDMALAALYPPEEANHEMVGMAQWVIDTHDGVPEIAFQVLDEWQGQGLGKYLLYRLIEIAQDSGHIKVKADVLCDNTAMNKTFERAGYPFERKAEFGVYSYVFDITGKPVPLPPAETKPQAKPGTSRPPEVAGKPSANGGLFKALGSTLKKITQRGKSNESDSR
ncbi:MAG: GNAT family N-acetyltransferase [SAR324 cluster bacterium]|nr:GNAT family N-acetyltransferase [SAR324 cluster bacterium]